jgi:predicted DNA-binding transcriptional regulator AlpA
MRRRQQNSNVSAAKRNHTPQATANPGGLFHGWIGIGQLLAATSLSAATVARLVAVGRFPPPLMRGRVRLWRVADVRMWIEAPAAYSTSRGGTSLALPDED